MAYISSNKISVFPASNRNNVSFSSGDTITFNPESKLTTEENLTSLVTSYSSDSFVIYNDSTGNGVIIFSIRGYRFEISDYKTQLASFSEGDIYASIKIVSEAKVVDGVTYNVKRLSNMNDNSTNLDGGQSSDTCVFYGLQITSTPIDDEGVTSLQLFSANFVVPSTSLLTTLLSQIKNDSTQEPLADLFYKDNTNNIVGIEKAQSDELGQNIKDTYISKVEGNDATLNFFSGANEQLYNITINNVENANACSGNAASATKLQTARTINISGDATGTAQSFDGTANVTIPIDVKKSAALDSTNVGDATHPVYFDANGKPVEVNQKIANDTSGKADTAGTADEAIKLQNSRTISLTGDATGSAYFDGSVDATITVDVKTAAALDSKNVGSNTLPVYFDTNGKPIACSYVLGSTIRPVYRNNNATLENAFLPTTYTDTSDVEIPIARMAAQMGNPTGPLNIGSTSSPIYFNNGIPTACSSTLGVSISGNASTASNLLDSIKGISLGDIFESDGKTVKNSTEAALAEYSGISEYLKEADSFYVNYDFPEEPSEIELTLSDGLYIFILRNTLTNINLDSFIVYIDSNYSPARWTWTTSFFINVLSTKVHMCYGSLTRNKNKFTASLYKINAIDASTGELSMSAITGSDLGIHSFLYRKIA